jgi:hypothetical protein
LDESLEFLRQARRWINAEPVELLFHLLGRNCSHGSSVDLVHDISENQLPENNAQIFIGTESYFPSTDGF